MKPLISVIVPVYDVEKYLDICIESIVNQTYENLEIILVDDGSPDNCPKMCDEWSLKDSRIHVIHKENGGLSSARNAALDICRGEYISFVDSDDYIHVDMYQIMMDDMIKTNADVVKCSRYICKNSDIFRRPSVSEAKSYNQKEILDCYFYHKDDFCGGVWDKLYKAEIFKQIRFPDGINSEDYYVYASIYNNIDKLYYNNIPLYYYRVRDNSICTKKEIDSHSYDKIKVSDMVKAFIDTSFPSRSYDALAFQIICRYATYYSIVIRKKNSMRKEWRKDLSSFLGKLFSHKKIGIGFKIKYLMLTYIPSIYKLKTIIKPEH